MALSILTGNLGGADWPQWRGPNRDGLSSETGLLKEWPESGPRLLWQVRDVGAGYSTPAVVGGTLYLLGNEGLENEFVQARAGQDGSKRWSVRIGKVGNPNQKPNYPAARSTPTVDGDKVYVLGSDGDLACLEKATGKMVWTKNVRSEFGGKPGIWAYAESPLIDGDLLICTPGGAEATLVAVNKLSGQVIWKSALPGGDEAGYASLIVMEPEGRKQYVQFLQKGVVGVDAKTGAFLWRYERTAKGSPANIPTPIGDKNYVYTGAGLSGGGLIQLKLDGDKFQAEQLYFSPKLPTAIGGAVKIGEYLFGASGQALLCVEFTTGKIQWEDRSVAPASVCHAEGRLYLHGENGEVALVESSPKAYRQQGRFTPPNPPDRGNSKAWAYPVVANGRLYLRDMQNMWCYDIAEK